MARLGGPARPTELALGLRMTKTNLSNHLACLRGCGLVVGVRSGRTITYRLVGADLEHALRDLLRLETSLCPASDGASVEHDAEPVQRVSR
ncbi:MAG: ArsR/SmtB family transcription factor [Dermatophilaceae bacterium]